MLDGLIADLFVSNGAIRELFGPDADPSLRLCRLFDVVKGDETSPLLTSLPDNLRALAHQFETGRLPQARQAALLHIQIQLNDAKASARDTKASSFMTLLERLVTEKGVEGGPEMAEALTTRHACMQEQGGLAGLKEAMGRLLALTGGAGPQDQLYPGLGPFADVPAPAPPDAGSARRHGRQAKADQQLRR